MLAVVRWYHKSGGVSGEISCYINNEQRTELCVFCGFCRLLLRVGYFYEAQ